MDLYVCGYNVRKQDPTRRDLPFPLPYHDANNGGRNLLLRNTGTWQFEDVTRRTGLDENNSRFTMAAAWEDYDNDGDQDLYVANDFGRNDLYRNDDGHFTDIAHVAGVEDQASGMSVTWSDANRDGRMDVSEQHVLLGWQSHHLPTSIPSRCRSQYRKSTAEDGPRQYAVSEFRRTTPRNRSIRRRQRSNASHDGALGLGFEVH